MVWSREFAEVVARASMAQTWLVMILMMMEDGGDDSLVAGVGSDMVVSSVENYHLMQSSVRGWLGTGVGSRELMTGRGAMQEQGLGIWGIGWGCAGLVSREVR
jgi:hypothetical protein